VIPAEANQLVARCQALAHGGLYLLKRLSGILA
jgi:hypothetical protein